MTQSYAAEQRPQQAHWRDRLWPVVADAAIACWTTDAELRFTAVDGAGFTQARGGASPGVVIGRSIPELFSPSHGPEVTVRVVAAYRAALAGDTVGFELRSLHGGRWRIQLGPLRGDTGEISGVVDGRGKGRR